MSPSTGGLAPDGAHRHVLGEVAVAKESGWSRAAGGPAYQLAPPSVPISPPLPAVPLPPRSKLRKLKETGDAIAMRVVEAKQRPQVRLWA